MNKSKCIIVTGICFLLVSCSAFRGLNSNKRMISPFDYGLGIAKTGIDIYWALYKAHVAAIEAKTDVDYSGIKSLQIEIPLDAKSIPLTAHNDFKGLELIVSNHSKDIIIFTRYSREKPISISRKDLCNGFFSNYNELRKGVHLLSITDETPWVDKRDGYNYGHKRKDILLIKNGRAINKEIYPYSDEESRPSCVFYESSTPVVVENITFKRTYNSTHKTFLLSMQGINEVCVKKVTSFTPKSEMVADYILSFYDCTNVLFENVKINGTYSQVDHSGYGILLNNIWNFRATNLFCTANWGIFGNNNVNRAVLEDCVINRFDVHCYGREFLFKNVKFENLYNQFSSVYGEIVFEKCYFDKSVPVLYEWSYNAFTQHDVYFSDCVVDLSTEHNYLIATGSITKEQNSRKSVSEKNLPNVFIKNMKVIMPSDVKELIVFRMGSGTDRDVVINYINKISINGMTFFHTGEVHPINLQLSNTDITTDQELSVEIKNLSAENESNKSTLLINPGSVTIGFNEKNHKNIVTSRRINKFIINK